ncbi:hypothetical protein L1887_61968 [Cichorium endivia]|nr:hypothetical protein L1887_61968 [Cichorium endivia]
MPLGISSGIGLAVQKSQKRPCGHDLPRERDAASAAAKARKSAIPKITCAMAEGGQWRQGVREEKGAQAARPARARHAREAELAMLGFRARTLQESHRCSHTGRLRLRWLGWWRASATKASHRALDCACCERVKSPCSRLHPHMQDRHSQPRSAPTLIASPAPRITTPTASASAVSDHLASITRHHRPHPLHLYVILASTSSVLIASASASIAAKAPECPLRAIIMSFEATQGPVPTSGDEPRSASMPTSQGAADEAHTSTSDNACEAPQQSVDLSDSFGTPPFPKSPRLDPSSPRNFSTISSLAGSRELGRPVLEPTTRIFAVGPTASTPPAKVSLPPTRPPGISQGQPADVAFHAEPQGLMQMLSLVGSTLLEAERVGFTEDDADELEAQPSARTADPSDPFGIPHDVTGSASRRSTRHFAPGLARSVFDLASAGTAKGRLRALAREDASDDGSTPQGSRSPLDGSVHTIGASRKKRISLTQSEIFASPSDPTADSSGRRASSLRSQLQPSPFASGSTSTLNCELDSDAPDSLDQRSTGQTAAGTLPIEKGSIPMQHQLSSSPINSIAQLPTEGDVDPLLIRPYSHSLVADTPVSGSLDHDRLEQQLRDTFQLDASETLVMAQPCWLFRSLLLQGHLYLTNGHLCFYAYLPSRDEKVGESVRISIPLETIMNHETTLSVDGTEMVCISVVDEAGDFSVDEYYFLHLSKPSAFITALNGLIDSGLGSVSSLQSGDAALNLSKLSIRDSTGAAYAIAMSRRSLEEVPTLPKVPVKAQAPDTTAPADRTETSVTSNAPTMAAVAIPQSGRRKSQDGSADGVFSTTPRAAALNRLSMESTHTYPPSPSLSDPPTSFDQVQREAERSWSIPGWLKSAPAKVLGRTHSSHPHASNAQDSERTSGSKRRRKVLETWSGDNTESISREGSSTDTEDDMLSHSIYSTQSGFSMLDADDEGQEDLGRVAAEFRDTFGVVQDEGLVGHTHAYLYRVLPVAGRFFVSERHLAFRSSGIAAKTVGRTLMLVPLQDVISAAKQLAFRPGHHGMVINISGHEELFIEISSANRRDELLSLIEYQLELISAGHRSKESRDTVNRERSHALVLRDLSEKITDDPSTTSVASSADSSMLSQQSSDLDTSGDLSHLGGRASGAQERRVRDSVQGLVGSAVRRRQQAVCGAGSCGGRRRLSGELRAARLALPADRRRLPPWRRRHARRQSACRPADGGQAVLWRPVLLGPADREPRRGQLRAPAHGGQSGRGADHRHHQRQADRARRASLASRSAPKTASAMRSRRSTAILTMRAAASSAIRGSSPTPPLRHEQRTRSRPSCERVSSAHDRSWHAPHRRGFDDSHSSDGWSDIGGAPLSPSPPNADADALHDLGRAGPACVEAPLS